MVLKKLLIVLRVPIFWVILIAIVSQGFFFNRGFIYIDEGYLLHAVQRTIQGELPYRDFNFIYTPGTIYVISLFFKIFGETILSARLITYLLAVLTSILIYQIVINTTHKKLFSVLAVLIYLSWGPAHINFAWPSHLALTFGIFSIYLIHCYQQTNQIRYLVYTGIITTIALLCKQNFGVATLLNSVTTFFLFDERKKNIIYYLTGFIIPLILFSAYLLITDSFSPFIMSVIKSTYQIIFQGALSNDFFDISKLNLILIGKYFFYFLPVFIALLSILIAKKYFFIGAFCLLFYIFGIRPTTDFNHLTILIAPIGLSLALIGYYLKKTTSITITAFILLIFLGYYQVIWGNYYRFEKPQIQQQFFLSLNKMNIYTDKRYSVILPKIISEIKKYTHNNEYIFICCRAPIFYFLTERKNPTRFIDTPPNSLSKQDQNTIISNLNKFKVKIIITHWPVAEWGNPILARYISTHYIPFQRFDEFTLWSKKK